MTTQEIISELRKAVDAVTFKRQMHAAADRLEELQKEKEGLLNAIEVAIEAIGKLEDHIDDLKVIDKKPLNEEMVKLISGMNEANAAQVKPEPSRLEIAAMFMTTDWIFTAPTALQFADQLIAAAKEVK